MKTVFSIKQLLKEEALSRGAKCCYCGKRYNGKKVKPTIDHVIPKSSRGKTEISNAIVCCIHCNSVKKKSLSLEEFIKLYPKTPYFLKRYYNKMKTFIINGEYYGEALAWLREYIK